MSIAVHPFNTPKYLASEESIREQVAAIQASWSPREKAKRAAMGQARREHLLRLCGLSQAGSSKSMRFGEAG